MASTTFTDGVTLTAAAWFNDVNTVAYTIFGDGSSYTGNITLNTNKFTVAYSSGNTVIAGTASIAGTLTAAAINASGNASFTGTINSMGPIGVQPGQKLVLSSADNTSGTYSLFCYDSVGNPVFSVRGDKLVNIASAASFGTGANTTAYFGTTIAAGVAGSGGTYRVNGTTVSAEFYANEGGTIAAVGTSSAHDFQIVRGGTERMRVTSTGATVTGPLGVTGVVTLSNLAGAGSRAVNADASGVLSAASDSRLKSEVKDAVLPGLAEVLKLQPRAYKWLDDIEKRKDDAAVEVGFFADEVKDIIPSAAPMGNDGYYGFYDRSVTAALVNAVKELAADFQAYKDAHP